MRAIFGINPFRVETARAILAGLAATALTAPLALLVDWPGPVAQVLATAALLVPLYGVIFWWSAAGAEERELLRLRVKPAVAAK